MKQPRPRLGAGSPCSLRPALPLAPRPAAPRSLASFATLFALALTFGLAAGCRSTPPAAYPIGIYGVPDTSDFPRLRDAGFNVVVSSATPDSLAAARHHGLQILAPPGATVDSPGFNAAKAADFVRRYDRDPALWAWYLSDEPDLHRIPPEHLRTARNALRQAGARKPIAIALFNSREADLYGRLADQLLLDRYPVPWLPLADFPKHLRLARFAAGPERPVYAVIQAFDWASYPELLPNQRDLRPPRFDEIRAMTFLALVEGAQGIFYYTFKDRRWRLEEHPETWEAVQRVVAEVRRREPLFHGQLRWRNFRVRYPDPTAQRNEALDPTVTASLLRVTSGNAEVPAGDYVVAVNTGPNPVRWEFGWTPPRTDPIQVLGETRSLEPGPDGWYGDAFEPGAVHVFGPLPGPGTPAR